MGLFGGSSKPKKVMPTQGEIMLAKIGSEQVSTAKNYNVALDQVAKIAGRDETPLLRARQAADNAQALAGANEVAALQMAASGTAGGTIAANRALTDEAIGGMASAAHEAAKTSADRIGRGAGAALARGQAAADILGSAASKQQQAMQNKQENKQKVAEAKQAALMSVASGAMQGVMQGSALQGVKDLNSANQGFTRALETGDKGQIAAARTKLEGLQTGMLDSGWAATNPFTGAKNRAAMMNGTFNKVGWAQRIGIPGNWGGK